MQRKLLETLIPTWPTWDPIPTDLLRQRQINSVPARREVPAPEPGSDPRRPARFPGATALPDDLLRPYQGYNTIRMWDYTGFGNYNALQAGVTRRFDKGFMVSAFYVWSKALTVNNDDFTRGLRRTRQRTRSCGLDYSYASYDRPHNFVLNLIYQMPQVRRAASLGVFANDWQISGVYRWTSGPPYRVGYSIPGIANINLTRHRQPAARVVVTCDPGSGSSSDPYRQIDTPCFAPPQPGSDGDESARFFLRSPPHNNLDLSLVEEFVVYKGVEVRGPARRVQRAQPHAVHRASTRPRSTSPA